MENPGLRERAVMPRRFHTAHIPRHPSDPGESLRTLTVSDLGICLEANCCEPHFCPCKAPYGGSIPPAASSCLCRWGNAEDLASVRRAHQIPRR
jgi:hypothetical protein